MLELPDIKEVPFIGQLVHYYPNNQTRNAAFVCEVYPLQRNGEQSIQRPSVNLRAYNAEGNSSFLQEIPAFDITDTDENADRKGMWTFPNEIATLQNEGSAETIEEEMGSNSNIHVGNLTL